MSDKLLDFYRSLQTQLQHHIHHVLQEVDPQVAEAEASLGDLSFCFGSVFGSVLFELIRESDVPMTPEQYELSESMVEPFMVGFFEKIKLLSTPNANPEKLEIKNLEAVEDVNS